MQLGIHTRVAALRIALLAGVRIGKEAGTLHGRAVGFYVFGQLIAVLYKGILAPIVCQKEQPPHPIAPVRGVVVGLLMSHHHIGLQLALHRVAPYPYVHRAVLPPLARIEKPKEIIGPEAERLIVGVVSLVIGQVVGTRMAAPHAE